MSNESTRPPVRIRFRMNIETGETEFIIDDFSPDRSEEYHDRVAHAIASFLSRNPDIRDAGPIRYLPNPERLTPPNIEHERQRPNDEQTN